MDAGRRLSAAGWKIEQIDDTPLLAESDEVATQLWFADGFAALAGAVARDGDPGAQAVINAMRRRVESFPADVIARALVRRTTLMREWDQFLANYAVLLLPVSMELPFPDGLDLESEAGFERVWKAQFPMRALAPFGVPGLTVSTKLLGTLPIGVHVVARRYREDLCLFAGEVIEAVGTPTSPIDPV